eukprot:g5839.t1
MSSTSADGRTKIIAGIRELSDRYDGFILDQFGVLHDGRDALPGAVECLEELRSKGKRLVILSNTSKRETFTMARLPKFGFREELFDGGVTSGEEGYQHLVRSGLVGGKAVLLGWNGEDTDGFLAALSLEYSSPENATFLVCHGPDNIVDGTGATRTDTRSTGKVEPYEAVFQAAIDRDLPMYNVNPDITVNNPQGGLWYMPGLLAKRYEAMGGRVTYFGKPHKEHYETAVAKMGLGKDRVVHVGDSLAHDIVGASVAGLDSVFIAGGICGEELGVDAKADKSTFNLTPDALEKIFARESLAPAGLGLLGLGVYAGFRKQIKADAVGAEALAKQGLEPLPFSPYRIATRALMYGTALSVGCFSAGVLFVGYSMGVTNLREFNDKMKVWAPEQMHRLGFRHRPEYIRDREAMRGMTYDEEWEYVDKLLERDEPGLIVAESPPPKGDGGGAVG